MRTLFPDKTLKSSRRKNGMELFKESDGVNRSPTLKSARSYLNWVAFFLSLGLKRRALHALKGADR